MIPTLFLATPVHFAATREAALVAGIPPAATAGTPITVSTTTAITIMYPKFAVIAERKWIISRKIIVSGTVSASMTAVITLMKPTALSVMKRLILPEKPTTGPMTTGPIPARSIVWIRPAATVITPPQTTRITGIAMVMGAVTIAAKAFL